MTELDQLREYKAKMESNPYTAMYSGLLKQWNALAAELEVTIISIAGDDKAFDRFTKFLEKLNPMTESIEKLRKKIGLESDIAQQSIKKINPIESNAK